MNKVFQHKISIIIPVYNVESYLIECLRSVINQTLTDIEILCINDGSTDNSLNILNKFAATDDRIKVIDKDNGGLSSARNAGILVASGEYIGFVDSDDWVDKNFFEMLYLAAIGNQADMAMGNLSWFSKESRENNKDSWISKIINKIKVDVVQSAEEKKIVTETNSVCNKLFLRSFLTSNSILFYEGLYWEDNPFTIITTLKANKIAIVREVFYYYRKHNDSISSKAIFDRKPFDIFLIMSKLKVFFDHEKMNLPVEFKHYYEEMLYYFYSNYLNHKVHKAYKKDFYDRVKSEFNQLNKPAVEYLSNKYLLFKIIISNNYPLYNIISLFMALYTIVGSGISTFKSLFRVKRKLK